MAVPITAPVAPTATLKHRLRLLWKRLQKDKIAFGAAVILILLYFAVAFAGFLSPYSENWNDRALANAPPTPIYMMDEQGHLHWPYVFGYTRKMDPTTYEFTYLPDYNQKYDLHFFIYNNGPHLFGVDAPGRIALLGNDMNGRDIFSRMLFGGRISLTIGFLALFIAFPLGLIYGGISGYYGGRLDNIMMRLAEIIMSIPSFFLLMSLAASLPPRLSSSMRFALVTVILAFVGWAELARVIRGMVLSIKEKEFIEAERAIGLGPMRIITRHILPQTSSFVLVALTMSVPAYILAESGLSFLGLGIQQPDASWGNMLKEAQDINNILTRPLMLTPGFLIFLAVLAFNVLGDAIRDILDPKSRSRV